MKSRPLNLKLNMEIKDKVWARNKFDWMKPGAATLEDWDEWHEKTKEKFPIRYFLYETIPLKYHIFMSRLRDIKWWFLHRFHPKHRYHMLKTGLKPGYYDPDTALFQAAFAMLCDFVDYQENEGHVDWNSDAKTNAAWTEMKELYDWYKVKREERDKKYKEWLESINDKDERKEAGKKIVDTMESNYNEDTEMLVRLVRVRGYMWF